MINPFVICSAEEIAAARAYADLEKWVIECQYLGATQDQARAYDAAAFRYAMTTVYPNSAVVAYARRVAREALARGEPMPTDPEQAIHDAEARELARLIDR